MAARGAPSPPPKPKPRPKGKVMRCVYLDSVDSCMLHIPGSEDQEMLCDISGNCEAVGADFEDCLEFEEDDE